MTKRIPLMVLIILFLIFIAGCSKTTVKNKNDQNNDFLIQNEIMNSNMKTDDNIRKKIADSDYTPENPLVILNPYEVSPLTAVVGFKTLEPVEIILTIPGDVEEDTLTFKFPEDTKHYIPVFGLYPGRKNQIKIQTLSNGSLISTNTIEIQTDGLPVELENAVTVTDSSDTSYGGLTLVSGGFYRNLYAFDSLGNIRWYLNTETDAHGYFPMENGRFMLISGYSMIETETRDYARYIYDMDLLGRLHKVYDIPTGIHHEIIEKNKNGNLLMLGNSLDGHVEDTILEVNRSTGEILKELNLESLIFDTKYNDRYDWAHMNSISYDRSENTLIVSARDLSSLIKIDWATDEILWILSDPQIWKETAYIDHVLNLEGSSFWHYEQHAAFELEEDLDSDPETLDLMLFDNRVIRNETMQITIKEDSGRSSVTQYAINENNGTVKQVKRFPNSSAFITSNFEYFSDRDLLIAYHGSLKETPESPINTMWGEIYEYNYSSGELVHSFKLKYGFYRAHKLSPNLLDLVVPIERPSK
ncbi:aryl-sulfate sulfotransferase [Alkalibacter mobilis]|uniref:aryl-sulfate sulfotransferase n=1 Tax=Alkalibacter mobilis TaxID=2787712 RepID=UPI00189F0681|nr:aryl-sulfate sulfotransferase [Alkalibacter mobilis]MBF7097196.1 aryl-sulfate sulfotransferase [Alkalibacter mobilis]